MAIRREAGGVVMMDVGWMQGQIKGGLHCVFMICGATYFYVVQGDYGKGHDGLCFGNDESQFREMRIHFPGMVPARACYSGERHARTDLQSSCNPEGGGMGMMRFHALEACEVEGWRESLRRTGGRLQSDLASDKRVTHFERARNGWGPRGYMVGHGVGNSGYNQREEALATNSKARGAWKFLELEEAAGSAGSQQRKATPEAGSEEVMVTGEDISNVQGIEGIWPARKSLSLQT
ncbi:hypothetical protein F0562_013353 [Nyssa sinensis]|uniref:Uncharacterized protein n=1 Tax=Nyssa sinensis TaxID=561372 RepID=A0A5J4ZPP2_9ASTE|nr:hypothetical protein F0562_013353 [Nyssa sinensis]